MIILEAPYPGIEVTSMLPNPTLGDTDSGVDVVDVHYSMNGYRRTYVKSLDDRILSYTFQLTRTKALELQAFVWEYFADKIRLTNHKGEVWLVHMINNPFEYDALKRAANSAGYESIGVNLQFRGVLNG